MSQYDKFIALLQEFGVEYHVNDGPDDVGNLVVTPAHDGFGHCFFDAEFTQQGEFIRFRAGY